MRRSLEASVPIAAIPPTAAIMPSIGHQMSITSNLLRLWVVRLRPVLASWSLVRTPRRPHPSLFGDRLHDCGPIALYHANPSVTEDAIVSAFLYCATDWPYAGVSNRDFSVTAKYLGLRFFYDDSPDTRLADLLAARPHRCVALLYGHFVSVLRGAIVGADGDAFSPDSTVFCTWHFY